MRHGLNPPNQQAARKQARSLLKFRLTGAKSVRRFHLTRAEEIAEQIWRHWQVGLPFVRLKHLQWMLDKAVRDESEVEMVKTYLTMRQIVYSLGRLDWLPRLDGSWGRQADVFEGERKPIPPFQDTSHSNVDGTNF